MISLEEPDIMLVIKSFAEHKDTETLFSDFRKICLSKNSKIEEKVEIKKKDSCNEVENVESLMKAANIIDKEKENECDIDSDVLFFSRSF